MKKLLLFALLLPTLAHSAIDGRLLLKNEFESPIEVLKYYISRDSQGVVWRGLDPGERLAFTTWDRDPETEGFLVAKDYELGRIEVPKGDLAQIEVRYQILGAMDGFKTIEWTRRHTRSVTFRLKRIHERWKIVSPGPGEIVPVLLNSQGG